MSNNIVQLTDYNDNNIYPIAGAAAQGSITKTMLEEGVFEGPELSEPSTVAYVATDNIQDGAVTSDKIDFTTSTVAITVGGRSVNANKIDLGNGITLVGGSFVLFNYNVSGTSTNIKIQDLPQMSSVFSVSVQGMQIGQAHSYTAYGYINPTNYNAIDIYIEGTTAGTNNLQVNFMVLGILAS